MQRLKFQESYWQTVLGGGPPPQIEMIMVVHKSKLVLSMAAGSGQLQFVTNTNKLNIEGDHSVNLETSIWAVSASPFSL